MPDSPAPGSSVPARERRRLRADAITVERIVECALTIVRTDGYDALTMRRVAGVLATGPASLYAHVRNKAELDDLLIGELCGRIEMPRPSAVRWRDQVGTIFRDLRDEFLAYPGISRAALAAAPSSLHTLRLNEGILAILLAGSVPPCHAAWAMDAAYLYVSAYCLEESLRTGGPVAPDRLASLPADQFPHTVAQAAALTSGRGHDRFDFTIGKIFSGLED